MTSNDNILKVNNFKSHKDVVECKKSNVNILNVLEFYKKLCKKQRLPCILSIQTLLKNKTFILYLDQYTIKDVLIISKVLAKCYIYNEIHIYKSNESKANKMKIDIKYKRPTFQIDKNEYKKKEKQLAHEERSKIDLIIKSISINIKNNNNLSILKLYDIDLSYYLANILGSSLKFNKSLSNLHLNKIKKSHNNLVTNIEENLKINEDAIYTSNLDNDIFNTIVQNLLIHPNISCIDLSNNFISDKNCKLIARLITRQSQLRDEIYWEYGLRNKLPLNLEKFKGLVYLDLSFNRLFNESAINIADALLNDNFIRAINLDNNFIEEKGISYLNKMLRSNNTILNIRLNNNPGYNNYYKHKISLKLAKNILGLFKKYEAMPKQIIKYYQYIPYNEFKSNLDEISKYNKNFLINVLDIVAIKNNNNNNNYKDTKIFEKSILENKDTDSNRRQLLDEENKIKIINNNKSSKASCINSNNADKNNYYITESNNYQRQPELLKENINIINNNINNEIQVLSNTSRNDLSNNNNNSEIEVSEEDIFNYSYQDDILFNNYSQSYISNTIDNLDNSFKNIDSSSFLNDDINVSEVYNVNKIENSKDIIFCRKPEKVFKELVCRLSDYKLKLFYDNLYLKKQIQLFKSNSNSSKNKFDDTEQVFSLTNTNFNYNNLNNISSNITNNSKTLDNNNISKNINNKPQNNSDKANIACRKLDTHTKNQNKIEDLISELNTLYNLFDKSK